MSAPEPAASEWRGRFFEDFEVGQSFRSRFGRTVTETDNVWFTALTHNGTAYGEHSLSAGSVAIPSLHSDTVLPAPVSTLVTVVTPAASMSAGVGATRAGSASASSRSISTSASYRSAESRST